MAGIIYQLIVSVPFKKTFHRNIVMYFLFGRIKNLLNVLICYYNGITNWSFNQFFFFVDNIRIDTDSALSVKIACSKFQNLNSNFRYDKRIIQIYTFSLKRWKIQQEFLFSRVIVKRIVNLTVNKLGSVIEWKTVDNFRMHTTTDLLLGFNYCS